MWDEDNRDKDVAARHLVAAVMMTVLVIVWMNWFIPPRPATRPAPAKPSGPSLQANAPAPLATPVQREADSGAGQWPYLPDVPVQSDPAADEITIEDESLQLVFTRVGARLKRATVLFGEGRKKPVQLVPEAAGMPDPDSVYPLGLRFLTEKALGDELDRRRFEATRDPSGRSVTFRLTLPEAASITKTFSLTDSPHVLEVQVGYENLEEATRVLGMDQTPSYVLNWGPALVDVDGRKGIPHTLEWRKDGTNETLSTQKMGGSPEGAPFLRTIPDAEWVALKSMYFVVAFEPEFAGAQAWATRTDDLFRFGIAAPRFEVSPGNVQSLRFKVYMGPCELSSLAAAWDTLPTVQRFFEYRLLDRFAKALLGILNWFYASVFANYGVGIIFLTALVRAVMFPLTIKQVRSMKKIQLLAPEIEQLKAKYSQEPQDLNKKMTELYRERGVNPLGGCLPMAVQIPVFIALYRMLFAAFEIRDAPFFGWITDLSQPDQLFHFPILAQVPWLGRYIQYINLLPILGALAMILSMKLTPTAGPAVNPQQKAMMMIMPVFFSVFCYNLQSGLNLYILVSTLFGVAQQTIMSRFTEVAVEPKKKAAPKRQHFYTAAKARQRRLARESKQKARRN